jgi:hypothetical protein
MLRARTLMAMFAALALLGGLACRHGPSEPGETVLTAGRWTGNGACLSVADAGCDFTAGCGHGKFAKPALRSDGTFDVDGTYRIEVGPVSPDPAPPAHFSGSLVRSVLTLKVVPGSASIPPASYTLQPNSPGSCGVACV